MQTRFQTFATLVKGVESLFLFGFLGYLGNLDFNRLSDISHLFHQLVVADSHLLAQVLQFVNLLCHKSHGVDSEFSDVSFRDISWNLGHPLQLWHQGGYQALLKGVELLLKLLVWELKTRELLGQGLDVVLGVQVNQFVDLVLAGVVVSSCGFLGAGSCFFFGLVLLLLALFLLDLLLFNLLLQLMEEDLLVLSELFLFGFEIDVHYGHGRLHELSLVNHVLLELTVVLLDC